MKMVVFFVFLLSLACRPVGLPPPLPPRPPPPPPGGPAVALDAGARAPFAGVLLSPPEAAAGAAQLLTLSALLPVEYERGRGEVSAALQAANRRLVRWGQVAPAIGAAGAVSFFLFGVFVGSRPVERKGSYEQ